MLSGEDISASSPTFKSRRRSDGQAISKKWWRKKRSGKSNSQKYKKREIPTGGNFLTVFLNTVNASIKSRGNIACSEIKEAPSPNFKSRADCSEIEEAPLPEFQMSGHLFRDRRGTALRILKAVPLVQRLKSHRSSNFKNWIFWDKTCRHISDATSAFQISRMTLSKISDKVESAWILLFQLPNGCRQE